MNRKQAFLLLAPALALGGCAVTPLPPRQQTLGCLTQGSMIACQQPDGTYSYAQQPPSSEAAPAPAQPAPPPPQAEAEPPPQYAPPPPPYYPPPPPYQYAPAEPDYPPPPPPGYYGGGYNNGY
jgi:hypothetical protein